MKILKYCTVTAHCHLNWTSESDFSTATPSANSSRSGGVVVVIRHVLLTISTDVIVIDDVIGLWFPADGRYSAEFL